MVEISILSLVLMFIFCIVCMILTAYRSYKTGYKWGWNAGIGDAAEEYSKGYNLGVLETIKKLSEEE